MTFASLRGLQLQNSLAPLLEGCRASQTKEAPMGLSDYSVEPALAVSDLEVARQFYEHKLGLVPGEEEEEAVRYPCAGGTRIFIYLSPANAGKSPATLAGWFVDDLDQMMDELASRGVVFEQYDQPGLKTDQRGVFDGGRFRAAWIKDPDGNTLALTEVSGEAPPRSRSWRTRST
jgi:catechol 2,3-dioxygenase-like lactoylglutathione lyase family enzyme